MFTFLLNSQLAFTLDYSESLQELKRIESKTEIISDIDAPEMSNHFLNKFCLVV